MIGRYLFFVIPQTHLWPRFFVWFDTSVETTSGSTICWQIRKVSRHRLRGDRFKHRFFLGWRKHPGEKWQKTMFFFFFSAWLNAWKGRHQQKFGWRNATEILRSDKKYGDDHFSPLVWAIEGSGFFFKRWLIDIMEFFKRRGGDRNDPKKSRWFWNFWSGKPKDGDFFLGCFNL